MTPIHPYPHTAGGHPSLVEMELTDACNATCVFCPREAFKSPVMMTGDVFAACVRRFAEAGMKAVKLVGFGEPTLHPRILEYMEVLGVQGLEVLLNTNGSRLHLLGIDAVLERADEVIFSLHSLDAGQHSAIFGKNFHAQAIANLEALLEANRRFGRRITLYAVATTLNPGVLDTLARYADRARIRVSGCSNRGMEDFASDIKVDALNGAYNHYPPITDDQPYCWYADAALAIDSRGRYRLCSNDAARTLDLGTVKSLSIADAFRVLASRMKAGGFLDFCRNCDSYTPPRPNGHTTLAKEET